MEFNPDGSLKLGGSIAKQAQSDSSKMTSTRCVKITKYATKTTSPKLCTLSIVASPHVESGFVERTYEFFKKRADATTKLTQLSSSEFELTIGGEFSRCKDCQMFVSSSRDYLDGNMIENKGTCTFKGMDHWY